MAIQSRGIKNRIHRPQRTDDRLHPMNELDKETRESRSPGKKRNAVTVHSRDSVDTEEIREKILIMREKGMVVYHINCKERCNIADDELVSIWRKMLIKWMFYVVDCCKLQRHAVAVAAYFLDVAILRDLCKTREDHQLAAATALQMALKTFDTAVIQLDKLVQLGRGQFTEEDVATMERKIISSLNWYLHPPTMYCFLRQYEQLAPSTMTAYAHKALSKVLKIIAEEMTLEERYVKFCPSIQGLAAIMVALDFVPDEKLPSRLRKIFESRLAEMADKEEDPKEVSKVTKKIYRTLKNRNKFQTIIDSTSKNTRGATMYQKVLRNAEKSSKKKEHKVTHEQHSPRDVKAKLKVKCNDDQAKIKIKSIDERSRNMKLLA
eukprot:CAMPEP_0116120154 /NCGR_PEP_ID=MMETSP0329-20121206/3028_1 /TAXON_ID=697910 /ORGANISM="Pseudo-nitzschia arenysensis, Strain B593" /LENGTH=377 /DNA_ID=CAMNT_0003613913 /DNA_START=11 /DNA_END=1144 /DNA_ORIENTATION=-